MKRTLDQLSGRAVRMNFTLPPDLAAAFREHCEDRGLNMSAIITRMIADEIDKG